MLSGEKEEKARGERETSLSSAPLSDVMNFPFCIVGHGSKHQNERRYVLKFYCYDEKVIGCMKWKYSDCLLEMIRVSTSRFCR